MDFQIVWTMFPIFMGVLWVLATFRFRFLQRGKVNAWLGITAMALHSNLLFYGQVEYALLSTILVMIFLTFRSFKNTDVSFQSFFSCNWCLKCKDKD